MCTLMNQNWLVTNPVDTTTLTSRYFTRGFGNATDKSDVSS